MEFALGLVTGIALGFIWGIWRATQSFIERIMERPDEIREIMQRVEKISKEAQTESSKTSNQTTDIKIEKHNGMFYLYDYDDTFLAQGSDIAAALTAAERRFPDRKFFYRLNDSNESSQ
jgi:hypothetical protein